MITIQGKYNEALVYTDFVDNETVSQIIQLCNQSFTEGLKIRIMPDVHAGLGCTIGTTLEIRDKVVPNLVGVDIGCGMEVVQLKNSHIELQKLDKLIYEKIPSGFSIRKKVHKLSNKIQLNELRCKDGAKINIERALLSLGTLGGGNHFIEVNEDEEKNLFVVIHSGSRHLGLEVAKYYQRLAVHAQKNNRPEIERLIKSYKKSGREREIEKALKELHASIQVGVPSNLTYLSGQLMEDYLHDMRIIQEFARLNRKAMMDELITGMKWKVKEEFTTIHNYIDMETMILRKGAVSAREGEKLIIPINMRDGSLICLGKGNKNWNESAPHGAGRLMSRSEVKKRFTLSEYRNEMKEVYSTSINASTLDECPMAYKKMDDIVRHIDPTVKILKQIKPIYNFKAGAE